MLDEVRLGRRQVEPPPLHRRLQRRVLEPVMELRVGELHHGVDGLRAQVDIVVGEAVGQRAQPALLDERAHQRPVLHVLHVEERQKRHAHLVLRMIGRRTGRRALDQRDEADHVDRLREEQQEARVVQAGRALEQHLELREWWLVPVPLETRGDLGRRLLIGHALAHILKQALKVLFDRGRGHAACVLPRERVGCCWGVDYKFCHGPANGKF